MIIRFSIYKNVDVVLTTQTFEKKNEEFHFRSPYHHTIFSSALSTFFLFSYLEWFSLGSENFKQKNKKTKYRLL